MLISDWSSDVCSSDLLGDAGDLRLVIAHRIETLAQALVGFPEPARLPEIDVARQFANDDQIDRPRDFRTQGGRIGKLGEKLCRDRKSVVEGKSVSVRVVLGGRRYLTKKK